VAALLGDRSAVEHDDVVDLVQSVALVGDQQDGTALSGPQQVGGEDPAAGGVQVGGGRPPPDRASQPSSSQQGDDPSPRGGDSGVMTE
jgi:hypothetical protein